MADRESKRLFFDELYAFDSDPEEHSDPENSVKAFINDSIRPAPQSRKHSQRSSAAPSSEPEIIQAVRTPVVPSTTFQIPGLLRSASAPSTGSSTIVRETPIPIPLQRLRVAHKGTPLSKEVSFVEETPLAALSHQPTRRFSSPTAVKPPAMPRGSAGVGALGKRKREDLVLVAEEKRIFKGLNFFYLPNDDVSPVRKLRIKKAREHGANWSRVYDASITHLIVDKGLTYLDVAKFLKLSSIPEDTIIVNEDYPLQCMQFKGMLNHKNNSYLVPGFQQAVEESREPSPQNTPEESDHSLQLKAPPGFQAVTESPSQRSTQAQVNSEQDVEAAHQQNRPTSAKGSLTGAAKHGDELDEIMQNTKKLEHFLPGLDEDGYTSPEPERKARVPRKKKYSNEKSWQENFSCMKGGNGEVVAGNPNAHTIDILQEMVIYYERLEDQWRSRAYRKAISVLKGRTDKISTKAEALALPSIGERLADKIEEIVRTNRLRRLDYAKLEPMDHILQKFMDIYGVGHSQASKWVAQGFTTFDDLREKANLTDNQKLGLERYDDFLTRIPRDEVTALGDIIKTAAKSLDPEVNVIIGGSYRRGAQDSGDIDLIITKPGADVPSLHPFLEELVSTLTQSSFLVAALAVSRSETGSKWHGCCVLPDQAKPIWRRIDFLLVADCELGAALIYFTGNDIFNRSIRLLAGRKGMRLNQRGLYDDCLRGSNREKLTEGVLLEGRDEKRIFEILGVPWRKPEDRIC